MKFQLTTWDRISLLRMIEAQSGDMKFVRQAGRLMDALELSEAEQKEVGMAQAANGVVTWQDAARTFEIEVRDADAQLLRDLFTKHVWPGVAARLVVALAEKLGIPPEKEPVGESAPAAERPVPPVPESA